MSTKKSAPKKTTAKKEKSTMIKIAETIGQVAGELSVKKDQLTDMASHAIDVVKSKIHDITTSKVITEKKAAPKKVVKAVEEKVTKKIAKPVAKKATEVKKAVTKTVKKAAKKASPVKKAAKKVSGKK